MLNRLNAMRLKGQCKRGELPEFVCKYFDAMEGMPSKNEPLANLRLVVFDTETTGLDPSRDRIIEMGAIAIKNGEIYLEDSFELMISSSKKPGEKSISVHGLLPEEVRVKGHPEIEAIEKFLAYLGADVLVAHHTNFDVCMIEMAVRRLGIEKFFLYNHKIDTAEMARKLEYPHKPPAYVDSSLFNLDALCERYGISTEDRHRAWGDALITAKLFLKLSHEFAERGKYRLRNILSK